MGGVPYKPERCPVCEDQEYREIQRMGEDDLGKPQGVQVRIPIEL